MSNEELVAKIDAIMEKQSTIKNYIETQFGGVDLAGTPTEGIITGQLKQLNEKVKIQNGRIGKLENWRWFVLGGCAVVIFILEIIFHK